MDKQRLKTNLITSLGDSAHCLEQWGVTGTGWASQCYTWPSYSLNCPWSLTRVTANFAKKHSSSLEDLSLGKYNLNVSAGNTLTTNGWKECIYFIKASRKCTARRRNYNVSTTTAQFQILFMNVFFSYVHILTNLVFQQQCPQNGASRNVQTCLSSLPCPATLSTNFNYVLQLVCFSSVKDLYYPRVICNIANIWHICFFIVSGWEFFRNHERVKSTTDAMRYQNSVSKACFSSLLIVGAPGTKSTLEMGTGTWGQFLNVAKLGKTVAARVSWLLK